MYDGSGGPAIEATHGGAVVAKVEVKNEFSPPPPLPPNSSPPLPLLFTWVPSERMREAADMPSTPLKEMKRTESPAKRSQWAGGRRVRL